jgi:hypothetical protein
MAACDLLRLQGSQSLVVLWPSSSCCDSLACTALHAAASALQNAATEVLQSRQAQHCLGSMPATALQQRVVWACVVCSRHGCPASRALHHAPVKSRPAARVINNIDLHLCRMCHHHHVQNVSTSLVRRQHAPWYFKHSASCSPHAVSLLACRVALLLPLAPGGVNMRLSVSTPPQQFSRESP